MNHARVRKAPSLLLLGASAGGVDALLQILPSLPADLPMPVVVVLHLPAQYPSLLAEIFAPKCKLQVCEAEDKAPLLPGTIYFAPPDYHTLIDFEEVSRPQISLSIDPPIFFSRPSIDLLFKSAAWTYAPRSIGVLLSGSNEDGAEGLASLCHQGGIALVQDPREAAFREMPEAAIARCPQASVLSLSEIALTLRTFAPSTQLPKDRT